MFKNLTPFKLVSLTLVTIAVTFFNLAIVICEDPPGFCGYLFGLITGANITALFALFLYYLEVSNENHQAQR